MRVRRATGLMFLLLLGVILLACSFPSLLTSYEPNAINFPDKFQQPGSLHWMGTDDFGRDVFTRVLYGGRVTIWSALIIAAGSTLIATLWAAVSSFSGGLFDELMTRFVDILLVFPTLLFALLLVSVLEPGMPSLALALVLVRWPGYARILRGQIYTILDAEYLVAAEALGATPLHTIRRHIIPNSMFLILTLFGLNFGSSILSISTLSFLGFGVQLPQAEWGAMIQAARPFLQTHPYLMLFPGLAVMVTILTVNLGIRLLEPSNVEGNAHI
ncbi:MAG: ABC transporter permease [Anaerolineales bacterium]|nr:ABC transporter permease [Anaerolineales bacterium]